MCSPIGFVCFMSKSGIYWFPVQFLSADGSSSQSSQTQGLLKVTACWRLCFLYCHNYCKCQAFTVLRKYLKLYNLLPCLDINMLLVSFPVQWANRSLGSSWFFFWRECCLFLTTAFWWLTRVHCKGSLDGNRYLVCGGILFPLSLKDMPCLVFCQLYESIKAGYKNNLPALLKWLHMLWSVAIGRGSSLRGWDCYWET